MSNYFPRTYRLNSEFEFKNLLTKGTRLNQDPYLRLIWLPNSMSYPRLGLRITKKAVSLAVDRNRIKRIIRESFRLNQNNLNKYDIMVSVRRGVDQLNRENIQNRLNLLWQQCSQQTF